MHLDPHAGVDRRESWSIRGRPGRPGCKHPQLRKLSHCYHQHPATGQLGGSLALRLPQYFFDLILVDEGHHNVARSWERDFEQFPNAKFVSLTATPFRGYGREIAGERVYPYPFRTAMVQGYMQITAVNVRHQEISFAYREDSRRHTLEETLQLRDEEWLSRGVAFVPECKRSSVDTSIPWLHHLRETGTFHPLIAFACSVDQACQVRA